MGLKKFIIAAGVLISFAADAQVKQQLGTYGVRGRRIQMDSAGRIPTVQVGIRDAYAGFDTAQVYYSKVDSTVKVYTGTQWIDAVRSNPLTPESDVYRNYIANFHDSSFVDSTIVNVITNSTRYFNRGLVVNSTESGSIINSRLQFHNYGYLVNETFSQRLIFQVLDSSTRINIGVGIKNQGIANINAPRDMYSYISGYIGDTLLTKLYNYQESTGPFRVSSKGVLIRVGDVIEISLTQNQDSCVFYYRNLTTNSSLSLTRIIPSLLSGSTSRMGFPAIFLNGGHYRLMNYTISKPPDFDYVFIGNSVTWGHSVDSIKKAFVNILRTKTSANINNTSKSAGCTYDYLSVRENLNFRNKTVFLSGIMSVDPVPGRTDAQIKADYQTLVNRLRANGNTIIHLDAIFRQSFLGAGGWPQVEALNRWLDTTYAGIDTIVHFTGFTAADLYADLIHPNNAGHLKAYQQIVAKLPWLFEKEPAYFLRGVDTVYRKPGQDSIFYTVRGGAERAIKDSTGGGGGYTNLTQFIAQTAWRGFYSDGSGDVQEQAFGTSGHVWTSNGVSAAPTWQAAAGGGVTTLAAIGAVPNANGATISGSTLNLQPASASFGGVVTTGTQTFAGAKTLTGALRVTTGNIGIGDGSFSAFLGGIHMMELAPTGSNTPLTIIGGSRVIEYWDAVAVATAAMAGMGTNALPSTNYQISTYNASTNWQVRMQVINSDGSVEINPMSLDQNFIVQSDGDAQLIWADGGLNSVGIGVNVPSAWLHIKSGTTAKAPFKLTTGTNLTVIENGAVEYDGTEYYVSAGGTRQTVHKGRSGSFSGVGTATTVFTVTFGGTQPNATYKVCVTPTAALSAAFFYITNKTTTTFDVTYLAGLTGTVTFDWVLTQ